MYYQDSIALTLCIHSPQRVLSVDTYRSMSIDVLEMIARNKYALEINVMC